MTEDESECPTLCLDETLPVSTEGSKTPTLYVSSQLVPSNRRQSSMGFGEQATMLFESDDSLLNTSTESGFARPHPVLTSPKGKKRRSVMFSEEVSTQIFENDDDSGDDCSLLPQIDTEAATQRIDTEAATQRIDTEAATQMIDTEAATQVIDTEAATQRIDTEAATQRIDTEAATQRIDTEAATQVINESNVSTDEEAATQVLFYPTLLYVHEIIFIILNEWYTVIYVLSITQKKRTQIRLYIFFLFVCFNFITQNKSFSPFVLPNFKYDSYRRHC